MGVVLEFRRPEPAAPAHSVGPVLMADYMVQLRWIVCDAYTGFFRWETDAEYAARLDRLES